MKRAGAVLLAILLLVPLLSMTVYAADDDGIGGFFADLGNTLLEGLKKLFIPREDYFPRLQDRLFNAFQAKFGGVLSVANYLKGRLSDLRAYRGDFLKIKFPNDHFFGGVQIDLLQGAEGIAEMIRGGLSGFVMLCTVAFCYKKVNTMINT